MMKNPDLNTRSFQNYVNVEVKVIYLEEYQVSTYASSCPWNTHVFGNVNYGTLSKATKKTMRELFTNL